jgi:RNAse (barnase) inhibitor barstar
MALTKLGLGASDGVHILAANDSDACDQLWAWQRVSPGKRIARVVRARKCPTQDDLFDEFAAAWQFPYYFGENWDALEECLTDLEWLPASAYLLLVTHAAHVLEKDATDRRITFWKVLHGLTSSWSQTRHPAVPFHVVAHVVPQDLEALRGELAAAGIQHELLQ